jgi:carbonic anhydrase
VTSPTASSPYKESTNKIDVSGVEQGFGST